MFPAATIHSFEPLPSCYEALRRNVAGLSHVVPHPIALGDKDGTVVMHVNRHSHSSSLLPVSREHKDAFPNAVEIDQVAVRMTTLDRFFEGSVLEGPTLLKLDVQGYEANTVEGARDFLRRVEYVLLETSFTPLYVGEQGFEDMLRIMTARGFRFERALDWLLSDDGQRVLQMDALFLAGARDGSSSG